MAGAGAGTNILRSDLAPRNIDFGSSRDIGVEVFYSITEFGLKRQDNDNRNTRFDFYFAVCILRTSNHTPHDQDRRSSIVLLPLPEDPFLSVIVLQPSLRMEDHRIFHDSRLGVVNMAIAGYEDLDVNAHHST